MFHVRLICFYGPHAAAYTHFKLKRKTNCSWDNAKYGKARGIANTYTYHVRTHTYAFAHMCVLCFIATFFCLSLHIFLPICTAAHSRLDMCVCPVRWLLCAQFSGDIQFLICYLYIVIEFSCVRAAKKKQQQQHKMQKKRQEKERVNNKQTKTVMILMNTWWRW